MSKVELAGLDGLIERMKDQCLEWHEWEPEEDWSLYQRDFQNAAAKLEALRDCARELAGFAVHKVDCATWKRLYSEEIAPCTCGLDEALARFREVGEEK